MLRGLELAAAVDAKRGPRRLDRAAHGDDAVVSLVRFEKIPVLLDISKKLGRAAIIIRLIVGRQSELAKAVGPLREHGKFLDNCHGLLKVFLC